jgi:phosphate:Na+ symporter
MTEIISNLFGGLGLLLFGMSLMTDGLKLASGNALRDILAKWTRTRLRGLCAGFLVTSIVQSSSAVTVATLGFANAEILTLERAIWVIYGSNVGTTMTAWIVALVGFKVDIDALALPLLGAGALLKFTGGRFRTALPRHQFPENRVRDPGRRVHAARFR